MHVQSREDTEMLFSIIRSNCNNSKKVIFYGTWTNYEDQEINETYSINPITNRIRIDFGKLVKQNIKIIFDSQL